MSPLVDPAPALAQLTTMRVGGPPAAFWRADSRDELVEAALAAEEEHEQWIVLGGGSNLVAPDAGDDGIGFPGAVVQAASRGIRHRGEDDAVRMRVEAVAEGWSGVEALSGIPGSVGAAPVQNIGAYGQELADVLVGVELLDVETGDASWLPAAELGLGYRTSAIKRGRRGVVLAVELELGRGSQGLGEVRYEQLAAALGVGLGERVPVAELRAAVIALRASKGMVLDPADPASVGCGSFFTNPIVDEALARRLPADAPRWPLGDAEGAEADWVGPLGAEVPARAAGGPRRVKLSAAWLIERSGIPRGFTLPGIRAGISPKHTLAIVNLGGATADDVVGMATYVQTRVAAEFGVVLEPEPRIL